MAVLTGELDFSQVAKEDFKSDLDLRVAVVRDGKVLGSAELKPPLRLHSTCRFRLISIRLLIRGREYRAESFCLSAPIFPTPSS